MNHLHAYWRMEYVTQEKGPEERRPFADMPGLNDDENTLIISRESKCFIVMNRYPYNAGHLLILPYREIPDVEDLDEEERLCFFNTTIKAKRILKTALKPNGFNIGMNLGTAGGAGIPGHLHCHVVPRWSGDTNFMPVLGSTRVLPQSLAAMWKHLRETADTLAD